VAFGHSSSSERLAGWQLPAHASALEAVVESGLPELLAECPRVGSELSLEGTAKSSLAWPRRRRRCAPT
jgi:hypothetical protein